MDLLVLAKEPVPGRVKTRLCPPCTPAEAAALAAAALADTLAAACGAGADRVMVALDGHPGEWLPPGVVVVDQGEGPLDRRLARAWSHARGPALQVGMDTPQLTATDVASALAALDTPGGRADAPAVFGPAVDGRWWTVGMRHPGPGLFLGIPTSRPDTGARQRARLVAAGRRVVDLERRRDVDTIADAHAVAAAAPQTGFARALAEVANANPAVAASAGRPTARPVAAAGSRA